MMWCMAKRLSVSLAEDDTARIDVFTRPGPARTALENALGRQVDLGTEAAVIRALIEVGARALHDDLLEVGYAEAAVQYAEGDPDRRAARRRHLDRSGSQL